MNDKQTQNKIPDTQVLPEYHEREIELQSPTVMLALGMVVGISLLILSFCFNVFLLNSNSTLSRQRTELQPSADRVAQNNQTVQLLVQDLANYSLTHPEVKDLLAKYGYTVQNAPPIPTGPAPGPFQKR